MENIVLNKELRLSYPDGFHQMTAAECKSINLMQDGKGLSLGDKDLQTVICVGWKKTGLGSLLMNADDVAKNMVSTLGMGLKNANYQASDLVKKDLSGQEAVGFHFSYDIQGEKKEGVSLVVEKGKTFYYFNFYGNGNRSQENAKVFETVLNSVQWG